MQFLMVGTSGHLGASRCSQPVLRLRAQTEWSHGRPWSWGHVRDVLAGLVLVWGYWDPQGDVMYWRSY